MLNFTIKSYDFKFLPNSTCIFKCIDYVRSAHLVPLTVSHAYPIDCHVVLQLSRWSQSFLLEWLGKRRLECFSLLPLKSFEYVFLLNTQYRNSNQWKGVLLLHTHHIIRITLRPCSSDNKRFNYKFYNDSNKICIFRILHCVSSRRYSNPSWDAWKIK